MQQLGKNNGIALITVLSLLVFMAVLLYGLASLTTVVQSDVTKKNDIILARTYANNAIFDSQQGALAMIVTFDQATFTNYGNKSLESMTPAERLVVKNAFFRDACQGGPTVGPAGFNKGLCATESAINNYSLPLLRVDTAAVNPCDSTSFQTVLGSGQNALPIIDDKTSRYSFTYVTGDNTVCHQPNYTIELMNTEFQIPDYVNRARLYRVTARAYGRNGNTQATQQAYFYVRCPNGVCSASLLNSQVIR